MAFIGFLQLIVFGLQAHRLKQTVDATKIAAEAAKKSARAAFAAQRAQVFVHIADENIDRLIKQAAYYEATLMQNAAGGGHDEASFTVDFVFKNLGPTRANLKEVQYEIVYKDRLPDEPDYTPRIIPFKKHVIGGNDETGSITHKLDRRLLAAEMLSLVRAEAKIYFFGRVTYTDIFGDDHEHGFLFGANSNTNGLRPLYEPKAYLKNI